MFVGNRLKIIAVVQHIKDVHVKNIRMEICYKIFYPSLSIQHRKTTSWQYAGGRCWLWSEISSLGVKTDWGDRRRYRELLTVSSSRLPSVVLVSAPSNSSGRTRAETIRRICTVERHQKYCLSTQALEIHVFTFDVPLMKYLTRNGEETTGMKTYMMLLLQCHSGAF